MATTRSFGLLLLLAVPAGAGCTSGLGLGTLEDVLGAGGIYGNEVSGQIRTIDTRRQEIELVSSWGGGERFYYDRRTEVLSGNRRYDVRDLSRGDHVRVGLEDDRGSSRYARWIEIERGGRDRRDSGREERRRLQRLDGTIGDIDVRQGWFELYPDRGRSVIVTLARDAERSARDRLRRLRRGNRVRFEGVLVDRDRVELVRFR